VSLRLNRVVVYLSIKRVFELSDKHNYVDFVHLLYLILLYVSVVQISHHCGGGGAWKHTGVKGRGLALQVVDVKFYKLIIIAIIHKTE